MIQASWDDAFNICKDELGGQLVSVQSLEKQQKIMEYVKESTICK
jgi:hypothetical protein